MIRFRAKTPVLGGAVCGWLLLGGMAALHAQGGLPRIGETRDDQRLAAMKHKLATIIIPQIEFRSTTLADAIEFLRQESRRLDPDPNPEARGVNIFLKLPAGNAEAQRPVVPSPGADVAGLPAGTQAGAGTAAAASASPGPSANTRITLTLSQIPLLEALKYVADQAGLKVKVEPYAVSIVPLSEVTDAMVTAVFSVPPNFISNVSTVSGGSALDQPATSANH